MSSRARHLALFASLVLNGAAAAQAQDAPAAPVAQPAPRAAGDGLAEMVRGQRDARWQQERSALRQSLEEAGLEDKKLQDAVVEFAKSQDESREALRAASARCWDGLRDPGTSSEALAALLKGLQDAAAAAQATREKSLGELEAKVHFKSSPRLQMLLRLKGLLGSEAWLAGDALSGAESFDLRILYPPPAQ